MTGLAAKLHLAINCFCTTRTCGAGISIPKSPSATMTPSVSFKMSSKLLTPCWFSILAMIWMSLPSSPKTFSISLMSLPVSMKEAKTMCTPFLTPNSRSALSFSDKAGKSTSVPGKLTPLWEQILPALTDLTFKVLSSTTSRTSKDKTPSST
ncbi:hypothetical protein CLUG_00151 [Clavispora lusitaniae ATCC 42720]|uniref:Uncharacterized protein n=1 Tax=Clavispora lusitaniae (strain ATCC 42720) TaxID=306902 RepID=C4XW28_CLAL4|nr:uncharacterized protein CLUG_00151 [Clavispora lusitaniae ATCC 42720]EEQ36029.1 hypothetical protein CLUG_00151 [Clavispora lusitaniae ATCC 42720]